MNKDFDFNRIGKRMPYTAPENFLDDIENNVWEAIKDEMTHPSPNGTIACGTPYPADLWRQASRCYWSSIFCRIAIRQLTLSRLNKHSLN